MRKKNNIIKDIISYIIIFVVVIAIKTYVVTPILVQGQSMLPTLNGGELMILNVFDKNFERLDVVVVDTGDEEIIKRIIALPGETIMCQNGVVYVNDRKIDEDYINNKTSDFAKVKLGADEYFVMGDNRANSKDSRSFGPFKRSQIKGTASLIFYPFSEFGFVK